MALEFSINPVMLSENHAVGVEIEIFGAEKLDDSVVVFVVDENGAENGLFGIDVAGKGAFENLARHNQKPTLYTRFLNTGNRVGLPFRLRFVFGFDFQLDVLR